MSRHPKGPKIEKIQDRPPGLKFSIEIEIFKRATRQPPIFVGKSEEFQSRLTFFNRDWKFQSRLILFNLWALRAIGSPRTYTFTPNLFRDQFCPSLHFLICANSNASFSALSLRVVGLGVAPWSLVFVKKLLRFRGFFPWKFGVPRVSAHSSTPYPSVSELAGGNSDHGPRKTRTKTQTTPDSAFARERNSDHGPSFWGGKTQTMVWVFPVFGVGVDEGALRETSGSFDLILTLFWPILTCSVLFGRKGLTYFHLFRPIWPDLLSPSSTYFLSQ